MKGKKGKQIVAKKKSIIAMRKLVGWKRSQWINELESALGGAFIFFAQWKLAEKNGQRRHARSWASEFERLLFVKLIDIHCHPVKRGFDRQAAFEEAVTEMGPGTIPALQEHVERQFAEVCKVRRGLDDGDVKEFWKAARWAARIQRGVG
jgi:hypothetical protein